MPLGEVSSEGSSVADVCGRGRDAVSTLCQASVAGLDRTGRRIADCTVCRWTSRCDQAVVHAAAPTRGAIVIRKMMNLYRPKSGELTALRFGKVAPMRTKSASPPLRAILPTRWKAASTYSRCVSSRVQVRRSLCRAASAT